MVRSMTPANRLNGVGVNGGVWRLPHMLRCGVVRHPQEWGRASYPEIMGHLGNGIE
jgi:hypothetical protein